MSVTKAAAAAPMTAVLAEFGGGTTSLAGIAERTGLGLELVRAVVDRMVAMRLVDAQELVSGCPPAGCGDCAVAATDGPRCAPGPSRSGGPVLLRLRRDA